MKKLLCIVASILGLSGLTVLGQGVPGCASCPFDSISVLPAEIMWLDELNFTDPSSGNAYFEIGTYPSGIETGDRMALFRFERPKLPDSFEVAKAWLALYRDPADGAPLPSQLTVEPLLIPAPWDYDPTTWPDFQASGDEPTPVGPQEGWVFVDVTKAYESMWPESSPFAGIAVNPVLDAEGLMRFRGRLGTSTDPEEQLAYTPVLILEGAAGAGLCDPKAKQLSVDPPAGPDHTRIRLQGRGFSPLSPVRITVQQIDDWGAGLRYQRDHAVDAAGRFHARISLRTILENVYATIADVEPPANFLMIAEQDGCKLAATYRALGNPSLELDPPNGSAPFPDLFGAAYALRVNGSNFSVGGPVFITVRDPQGVLHRFDDLDLPMAVRYGEAGAFVLHDLFAGGFWQAPFQFPGRHVIRAADRHGGSAEAVFHLSSPLLQLRSGDIRDVSPHGPVVPRGGSLRLEGHFYPPGIPVPLVVRNGFHDQPPVFPLSRPQRPAHFPLSPPDVPGHMIGWGSDTNGQISGAPVLSDPVIQLAAGNRHTLALWRDQSVGAWGWNGSGECTPPPDLGNVVRVAAGWGFSLALEENGRVRAWGGNLHGAINVPEDLGWVVSMDAGHSHVLALQAGGTVRGWGRNDHGQADPPEDLAGVVQVAAGETHSLALRGDGTVVAWGEEFLAGTSFPPGLSGVVQIAAGNLHSLALREDGTVVAWGSNQSGQLAVPVDLGPAVAVAAGDRYSMALTADGRLVAWGLADEGRTAPPSADNIAGISAGSAHGFALGTAHPMAFEQLPDENGFFSMQLDAWLPAWPFNRTYQIASDPGNPRERVSFVLSDCDIETNEVSILGVEVTQGIQNLDNTVPLVRAKDTFVRVFLASDIGEVDGVRGHLRAQRNGENLLINNGQYVYPFVYPYQRDEAGDLYESQLHSITVRPQPLDRMDTEHSLLFKLPAAWIAEPGELKLAIRVFFRECAGPDTWLEHDLDIVLNEPEPYAYTRIRVAAFDAEDNVRILPLRPDSEGAFRRVIRNFFPLAEQDITSDEHPDIIKPVLSLAYELDRRSEWDWLLSRLWYFRLWNERNITGDLLGMVHGEVPAVVQGSADRGKTYLAVQWLDDDIVPPSHPDAFQLPLGAVALAHEIGHLRDFGHADDECANMDAIDFDYPYHPSADIGDGTPSGPYGFYADDARPLSHDKKDIMSYCWDYWISEYHYLRWVYRYNRPMIARWSPETFIAGGGDQPLHVHGASFRPHNTVLRWNGEVDLPAVIGGIRQNELTVTIPGHLLESAGSASIQAVNYVGAVNERSSLPIDVPIQDQPIAGNRVRRASPAPTESSGSAGVYFISGRYNPETGEAGFGEGFVMDPAPSVWLEEQGLRNQTRTEKASEVRLQLRTETGGVLEELPIVFADVPFCPSLQSPTFPTTDEPVWLHFAEMVDWNPDTARVEMVLHGTTLVSRARSAHSPVIQVLHTLAGALDPTEEPLDILLTDPDGDPIDYVTQFSPDGGLTWDIFDPVNPETGTTNLPTRQLPGTMIGRFRIIASDGMNTTVWNSQTDLYIPDKPPAVRLFEPEQGAQRFRGQDIVLSAQAIDLEDGVLDGADIEWHSSLSGHIGHGRYAVVRDLAEGTHTIAVTATDSQGQTSAMSRILHVVPPVNPEPVPGADVAVVPGAGDTTGSGVPDWWQIRYYGMVGEIDASAMAANGRHTVFETYVAGLDPTRTDAALPAGEWSTPADPAETDDRLRIVIAPTDPSRVYGILAKTNLLTVQDVWTLYQDEQFGTGGPVYFSLTNLTQRMFLRTRVRLPSSPP